MSVPAQRALRSAIDSRQFDPVYYLHGDDDYRKDEAVKRIIAAAVDPATRDFNLDVHRGGEVDAERLAGALASLPMLAERRVVVLRDVGALKKAARAELDRYLRSPSKDTVLVIASASGDKPDADLTRHATGVPFPSLEGDKVAGWLVKHAREELGTELAADAADLLSGWIGGDLAHAAGELDKLASYASGRPVTAADVEAVVGARRGATTVDLLEAVAARDAGRALKLVGGVLMQPKTTAVTLVSAIAYQTLMMAWGRASLDSGVPQGRLGSEFMSLLKATRGYPGRPWGDAITCWAGNIHLWSHGELNRALAQLLAADMALKDTRLSSDEAIIESLVLALCVTPAHPVVA